MKTIILLFSIFLISKPTLCAIGHPASDSILLLYATKEKSLKKYAPGNFLKIFYTTDSGMLKIKGRLLKVLKDSIDVLPFGKRKTIERIAISKITAVEKLHLKGRKNWPLFIGISGFFAVLGYLAIESAYGYILFVLSMFSISVLLAFLLFSFLSDHLSKKSFTKGWRFYSNKGINKKSYKLTRSRYWPYL